jgi:hypothetical protein
VPNEELEQLAHQNGARSLKPRPRMASIDLPPRADPPEVENRMDQLGHRALAPIIHQPSRVHRWHHVRTDPSGVRAEKAVFSVFRHTTEVPLYRK